MTNALVFIYIVKHQHLHKTIRLQMVSIHSFMVRSAGLCVCVCGIKISIKHSKPSDIYSAGITMMYTNLNAADADANSR